jgi:hypothetical protein
MFTKSFTSPRRLSAYVLTLLLVCVSLSHRAEAQATTPLVTGSFAPSLMPPSGLGTVYQTALDSYGDLVFVDYANGGVYEYPVNGGAVITLAPAGSLGGYDNPGLVIGANNDLYLGANYNNCLLRFPYDTTTKTWDGLATVTVANTTADICPNSGSGTSPYIFAQYGLTVSGATPAYAGYYQPWALALDPNNNLIINAQNSGNFIFSLGVTGTGSASAHGTGAMILGAMGARAQSITEDKFGNIYFVEETDQKAPLPGVLMIPAGSAELTTDVGLTRVDPNLPAVTGVTTDASGNLYISDSTDGVFMVPNPAGTPQTAAAVLLTPLPAYGQVSVDLTRGIVYVPTQASGVEAIAKVTFNAAELGSTPAGTAAATSQSVLFGFNGAATPTSFVIQEAGTPRPDFTIATGGTCTALTAYAAQSGCSVNVTLSPHAVGNVSATLLAVGGTTGVLGSLTLEGTGTGSAVQVLPGSQSLIGAGLKTPSQLAVDASGNTYVADSGLGAVEYYPKGSGAVVATNTVGTGLTAPTGVAVDGGGDVYIADSGNVIEVPTGAGVLKANGQQVTVKSGLGKNLKLATDGFGDLYISDPDNHRVVKLASVGETLGLLGQTETDLGGFNAPSAIAVDASGNLYVADGSNLFEVTPAGTQTTLLTTLSNATGLAVDPSGAVYVAMPGGTLRIPAQTPPWSAANATTIASSVSAPTSVAIDSVENVYVTDATAEDVDFVGASASTNFGTLTSTTGMQTGNYTILDAGNATLNITGFSSTPDYSATANTCTGPIAVGASCTATVTFNPGPGDQGPLAGQVLVQSDAANAPVGVNVTGVGAALAASTTVVTVSNATVDGAPAAVSVSSTAKGGAAPTGLVTLTITGANLKAPVIVTGTLANGAVTLTPPQLPAGAYTYSVAYQGDRVYGSSTATAQVTVAVGVVMVVQPTAAAVQAADSAYPLVLATGQGASEPYDGSVVPYEYTYPVQVIATDKVALIGQPVYTTTNGVTKLTATNYGSVTYAGASVPGCAPVPVAADGTAPFSTSCFSINTSNNAIPDLETAYTITPMYSPVGTGASLGYTNPNYAPATGTAISFTALRNPVVQISSNPSSLTVAAGSTTTATLTLTSVLGYGFGGYGALLNNYSLPVQLACDGLPAYATCTFSYPTPDPSDPNSVDVGPVAGTVISGTTACTKAQGCFGPGTVIMTINTNIPTGIASLRRGSGQTVFAAMFGLGLLGFAFGDRKKRLRGRLPVLFSLLLCCALMAGVSGCSTTQLGTTASGNVSPGGKYTVLVTAKQVGSQVINNSGVTSTVYGNSNQVSLPFTMTVTVQ